MRHIFWIVALLMLMSCAATRKASTEEVTDNCRSTEKLDSIFITATQRDSIYLHDSIYVREKGDTVTKYVERVCYHYKLQTDTLYKYSILRDTVYIVKRKTICVDKPVYIEKPRLWYETGLMWVGGLCCLAAILWAIFLYLKRKF